MSSRSLRIVQLAGWYFPESLGGTETYVASLAGHLRDGGHHVLVAAPDPGAADERRYIHDEVSVYRYPTAAQPSRAEARHDVPVRGAERLHAWLREVAPDVVHMHTFVTGVGPHEIAAAKAAGARVVVTTHSGALGFHCQRGSLMHHGRERCDGRVTPRKCAACALEHRGMGEGTAALLAELPVRASRALGQVPGPMGTALGMPAFIDDNQRRQRTLLVDVHALVVLTEWARQVVEAQTPWGRAVVNRLGVRTPPSRPPGRTPQAPVRVAYLGRFDQIKGVYDLAAAVRALPVDVKIAVEFRGPQDGTDAQAVIARLRAVAAADPRIAIGDVVPPDKVYEYLASVDLLCNPTRTLEGGPTTALEAMAVGVPVVSTRLGAMAEVLTDGVNTAFVEPGDVTALTQVLARVVANPQGTIERWRTALPPVRTMADVARDYERIYQS